MFRRLICFILLIFSGHIAAAQERGTAALGVVLMHGKGGQPGGNIGSLAQHFESAGIKVVAPVMGWSGSRGQPFNYDVTYEQALREIDHAVAQLRRRGANRIVIAGQSLGANAALAYVARKPAGIAGVIALAPGHTPERMRSPDVLQAMADARGHIAAGQGLQRATFPDFNVGQRFTVTGTYAGWYSYYDPDGPANMSISATRLPSVPLLYVVGRSDPLYDMGRGYIFAKAKPHPKSRFVEIDAGHMDTPDRARADVLAWLKTL